MRLETAVAAPQLQLLTLTLLGLLALSCSQRASNSDGTIPRQASEQMRTNNGEGTTGEQVSIEEARSDLISELREVTGVTMIGIGECDGEPCLRVYVVEINDAIKEKVPETHLGWRVDLRKSGEVRALR